MMISDPSQWVLPLRAPLAAMRTRLPPPMSWTPSEMRSTLDLHARLAREYTASTTELQRNSVDLFREMRLQLRGWRVARFSLERHAAKIIADSRSFAEQRRSLFASDHPFLERAQRFAGVLDQVRIDAAFLPTHTIDVHHGFATLAQCLQALPKGRTLEGLVTDCLSSYHQVRSVYR